MLYKAHMLQVDQEHVKVFFEAIRPRICFEAFEFAVGESIALDERFPKVPRLLGLASGWKRPVVQDLSRPALEYCPPEVAKEKLAEIMAQLDSKLGTSFAEGVFEESESRARLRVVR